MNFESIQKVIDSVNSQGVINATLIVGEIEHGIFQARLESDDHDILTAEFNWDVQFVAQGNTIEEALRELDLLVSRNI